MASWDEPYGMRWPMSNASRIADALGGRKSLPRPIRSLHELRHQVEKGLPFRSLEAIAQNYGLDRKRLTSVLGMPPRTLARRRQHARFAAAESDRLIRLARIVAFAEEVLGTREKAGRWLQKPSRTLGGVVPLDLLGSDLGTREVETELGRIEHGIPV